MARISNLSDYKDTIYIIDREDPIMAEIDSKPFNEIAKCLFYIFNKNSYILVGSGEPTESGIDFSGIDEVWTGKVKDYEPITGVPETFTNWAKTTLSTSLIIYFDKLTNSFWKPNTVTTDLNTWTWSNITKDIELMLQDLYVPDGVNYARFEISSSDVVLKNNSDKMVDLRGYKITYNTLVVNTVEKILIRGNNLVLDNVDDVGSYSIKRIFNNQEFISVLGGTYTQTPESWPSYDNEFQHIVSNFEISKYQTTYSLWYLVKEWAIVNSYYFQNAGKEGNDGVVGAAPTTRQEEPVTGISWRDAIVWCNAYSEMMELNPVYTYGGNVIKDSRDANAMACDNAVADWDVNGFRLPTEGEWHYAASYIDGTTWTLPNYASGATADYTDATATGLVAWYDANSGGDTQDVGTKTPNQIGVYDMSGNVWEWCWDWYSLWPTGTETNYRGPGTGAERVIRGGSWNDALTYMQAGYRNRIVYDAANGDLGFRVALSITAPVDKVQLKWNIDTWELLKNGDYATLNVAYLILNGLMLDPDATGGITIDTFIPKYPYNKIIQSQADLDDLIIENDDYIYIDEGEYDIDTGFTIDKDNVRIDTNPNTVFNVLLQSGPDGVILIEGSNNTINMTLDCDNQDFTDMSLIKVEYKNQSGDLFYKNNKVNLIVKNIYFVSSVIDDWGHEGVFNINAIGFNLDEVIASYNAPRGIGWMEIAETFEVGEDEISERNIYKGQFGAGTYYNSVLYGFQLGDAVIGTTE